MLGAIDLLAAFAQRLCPIGMRALVAESVLINHALVISNRSRQCASNPTTLDRFVLKLGTQFASPRRISNRLVAFRPATLVRFDKGLMDWKYTHRSDDELTVINTTS